ncbi:MAG: aldose 1-epimerase [Chloroflexi bacterium]|nr:aldose 1-epimerase [Chloroflexota bacterium]
MSNTSRYKAIVVKDPVFHTEAFLLQDRSAGSSALVIPRLGNNLMSFVANLPHVGQVEVILGAPAGTTADNAWRWGNPILFPFPNRVRAGRYTFAGQQHQLDANMPEGHHLHGLVCYRPWRVDEAGPTSRGAAIRSSFTASDHPEVLRQYPFPFFLTVNYVLAGNRLLCEAEVGNTGEGPLPLGFGLHPYVRLPLGPGGNRDDCLISAPANQVWRLDDEKLPTGDKELVPAGLDFRQPRPLDGIYLDHSYTDLRREGEQAICRLIDPLSGLEVVEQFGPEFPELVVLAPADRSTVSFEPYTCVTDAINLAMDRSDTGLVILQPGAKWRGSVSVAVTRRSTTESVLQPKDRGVLS